MTWARCRFLICTKSGFSPAVDLLSRLSSLPCLPNRSSGPPVALPVGASPKATQMSTVHVLHLSHAPALPPTLLQTSSSGSPSQHHLVYVPPAPFRFPFTHAHTCLPAHACSRVCATSFFARTLLCVRGSPHTLGSRGLLPPALPCCSYLILTSLIYEPSTPAKLDYWKNPDKIGR